MLVRMKVRENPKNVEKMTGEWMKGYRAGEIAGLKLAQDVIVSEMPQSLYKKNKRGADFVFDFINGLIRRMETGGK